MTADRRAFLSALVAGAAALAAAALPRPAAAQQAYEDFVFAVANDRVDQVKGLLARGIDPGTVDRNGDPALVVAARAGYLATVEALLAARAKVDQRNPRGDTALMVAALNGHMAVVKALRARGACRSSAC